MVTKKSKVIVRDLGFVAVMKQLGDLEGIFVVVGIRGGSARRDGTDNVLIGSVHEFGAPSVGVPQRSFIRSTIDERRQQIADVQQKALRRMTDGKLTAMQASEITGQWVENAIKKKITDGDPSWRALLPATIARKGSSKALLDTTQMRSAVTHAVIRGRKPPKGQV